MSRLFLTLHFSAKTNYFASKMMLLSIRLSFLFATGQAIWISPAFPNNGSRQDQNGSALAQAPTPLRAVLRGLRAPLPFDEDIFDPVHVVSNSSRDCGLRAHSLVTLDEPLDFHP